MVDVKEVENGEVTIEFTELLRRIAKLESMVPNEKVKELSTMEQIELEGLKVRRAKMINSSKEAGFLEDVDKDLDGFYDAINKRMETSEPFEDLRDTVTAANRKGNELEGSIRTNPSEFKEYQEKGFSGMRGFYYQQGVRRVIEECARKAGRGDLSRRDQDIESWEWEQQEIREAKKKGATQEEVSRLKRVVRGGIMFISEVSRLNWSKAFYDLLMELLFGSMGEAAKGLGK